MPNANQLLNTRPDENPGNLPADQRRGWFRTVVTASRYGRGDPLDAITEELDAIAAKAPRWDYDLAWFTWELLRRSPLRKDHAQDRWHWDRPFPAPLLDGTCPPKYVDAGDALRRWIEPLDGPPMQLLDGTWHGDGPDDYPVMVQRGHPWVSVTLDLRATDEDHLRALKVLRKHIGVEAARVTAPRKLAGKSFSPPEVMALWERRNGGASIAALAREVVEPDPVKRVKLRAQDSDVTQWKRSLRETFARITDAIERDPWMPYQWGAVYRLSGGHRHRIPWWVSGVDLGEGR